MKVGKGMILGLTAVLASALIVPIAAFGLMPKGPDNASLQGEDFYAVRREALTLFPRGSRLTDATQQLKDIGFRCNGILHKLANINAESLMCQSNGRGALTSPAMNITVLSRNGLVSDIEVWNMLVKADYATAPPPPKVREAVTEAGPKEGKPGEDGKAKSVHGG